MTTIPARVGAPYAVDFTASGLIRISRTVKGRNFHIVLDAPAAIAVADALVDAVERLPEGAVHQSNTPR
ncbi:hypothetical protein CQY20_31945 [Mycolicibacterium agri]|uniref:Uncharacterized protein n=1 Tax=Mycolicibacterium agri TaxID=36811 RepID=A0A2A7MNG7_MYCAG|nr:hypothetical protein [Mycolicibacterium agri]PEG33226.1 hypothetical protein CQY20_31945 [Mycolicibacterium agri]GFG49456.1 hypothetical protein MAGR_08970 [Mycolicibacterium agri]